MGDHHSPGGGDFRIRSAVLWLKVEQMNPQQRPKQQQRSGPTSETTTGNVTIWIFNIDTSALGQETSGCTGTGHSTNSDHNVAKNCPESEFANYATADDAAKKRERGTDSMVGGQDSLILDEKVRVNLYV